MSRSKLLRIKVWTGVYILSIVGATTAWVGFTAAHGEPHAQHKSAYQLFFCPYGENPNRVTFLHRMERQHDLTTRAQPAAASPVYSHSTRHLFGYASSFPSPHLPSPP